MGVRGVPTGRVSGRRGGARGARRHQRGRGRSDDRPRRRRPDRPAGGCGRARRERDRPCDGGYRPGERDRAAPDADVLDAATDAGRDGAGTPPRPGADHDARRDPDAGAAEAEPGRSGRHRAQGDPDRERVLRVTDDRGALLHHGRQGPLLHRVGGGLDGGRPGAHGGALRLLARVRGQHRVRARVPRRKAAVRGVAGRRDHGRERLEALARP
jgi:hypothetical protein